MKNNFPIGSKWMAGFGNGVLIITVFQADRYYINDRAYSKIRLNRNFQRIG